jgi:hypothetical protein
LGQPTKKKHLSIPSPKPQYVRQLDDSRQQDVNTYLEGANSLEEGWQNIVAKNSEIMCRKLTLQLLTSGLDEIYKERITLFQMHNPGHQTRHFILKS